MACELRFWTTLAGVPGFSALTQLQSAICQLSWSRGNGTNSTFRFQYRLYCQDHSRTDLPHILGMVVASMPSVHRFRLLSDHLASAGPYPLAETGDTVLVPRCGQEWQVGLRFGAFLTHRRPTLKIMVLPADSGPEYGTTKLRVSHSIELYGLSIKRPVRTIMKQATPDATEDIEYVDLVMNSTAIRRIEWNALGTTEPNTLALPSDAPTSEAAKSGGDRYFFRYVDRKDYLTYAELRQKQLGAWRHVDELLEQAQRMRDRAAQCPGQRGRG
jgi:hypothetical protein